VPDEFDRSDCLRKLETVYLRHLDVREDELEATSTAFRQQFLLKAADGLDAPRELNTRDSKTLSEHSFKWNKVELCVVHEQNGCQAQRSAK